MYQWRRNRMNLPNLANVLNEGGAVSSVWSGLGALENLAGSHTLVLQRAEAASENYEK